MLIAEAFRGNERWEDAEYYYRQVIDIVPDNAPAMRNLAVVVYRQGRLEESEELFEQAKALPDLLHYFFLDYYFFLPGEVAEAVDLFVSFM